MDLKEKVDVLEKKILEERVTFLEEKLEKLTKARTKPIERVKKDLQKLDIFFEKHIVIKKGVNIRTVKVAEKVNEFFEPLNLIFNKFDVSKFMKEKGLVRKKIGSYNYYLDVELIE